MSDSLTNILSVDPARNSEPITTMRYCLLFLACFGRAAYAVVLCNVSTAGIGLWTGSQILYPNDTEWDNGTIRWTEYMSPTYSFSVRPALESDVQTLVKSAARCNISLLASSGQHGFSIDLSKLQHGMEIDMSAFRNVSVDAQASTLTVGGGVRFLDVFDPVFDAGKEISTGSGACVGMISPTIGGGVGRLQGLHGMISDQLLSARMVIANGSIVTASNDENSDLFWAIRGAGGNFGIVVEATYQLSDLTSEYVINMDYAFRSNASSAIVNYLSSFGENLPAKLSFMIAGLYDEDLFGGFSIIVNAIYNGPLDEAEFQLAPLLKTATPFKQNVSFVPGNKMIYSAVFGGENNSTVSCSGKGSKRSVFAPGIKSYDQATFVAYIEAFEELMVNNADLRSSNLYLEHFSTAKVLEYADESSAYPWRDILAHPIMTYQWADPANEGIVDAFGKKWRSAFQETSGFDPPQTYVNYGHGDEDNEVLYSAKKLPKLRELKKLWDPNNVFRFHHDILTE